MVIYFAGGDPRFTLRRSFFPMTDHPEISIIIPYGYFSEALEKTLLSTRTVHCRIEIILVTNHELRKSLSGILPGSVLIAESNQRGRGYFCATGAAKARGSILLFLHADTWLPEQWCQKVLDALTDPAIAGGGFSTHFRSNHWFVKRLPKMYNLFAQMIGEYWGDRAIFMRRKDLLVNLDRIKVPIMEDVEMSKIIHRYGKMILLPASVSTSANHFALKGPIRHVMQVILFRILYALGVSAERIYRWYYRSINGNN